MKPGRLRLQAVVCTVMLMGGAVAGSTAPAPAGSAQFWKAEPGLRADLDASCGLHITGTASTGWNLARGVFVPPGGVQAGAARLVVPITVNSISDSRYWPRLVVKAVGQNVDASNIRGTAYSPYRRQVDPRQDLFVNLTTPASDRLEVLLSRETQSPVSVDLCVGRPYLEPIPAVDRTSSGIIGLQASTPRPGAIGPGKDGKPDSPLFRKFAADRKTACGRIGNPSRTNPTAQVRYDADLLEDAAFLFSTTGERDFGSCSVQLVEKLSRAWRSLPALDLPHAHVLRAYTLADGWLGSFMPAAERALLLADVATLMRRVQTDLQDPAAWWRQEYANNYKHAFTAAVGIACERYRFADYPDCREQSYDEMSLVLHALPDDGSSLEGPGYWNYSLVWIVSYLRNLDASRRHRLIDGNRFLQNASRYRLHISVPGFREVIPYSDTDPEEYHRAGTALRGLGSIQNDPVAVELAERVTDARWPQVDLTWRDIAWSGAGVVPEVIEHQPTYVHLPDQGIVIWRSSWSDKDARLVLFKAGDLQGEKLRQIGAVYGGHNHPDQGEVLLYAAGQWILKDDGYTRTKATRSHNSLEFSGHGQLGEGAPWFDAMQITPTAHPRLEIVKLAPDGFSVRASLASVYPAEAQVGEWTRQVTMDRNGPLEITDAVRMTASDPVTWQFHTAAEASMGNDGLCIGRDWLLTSTASTGSASRPFVFQWRANGAEASSSLSLRAGELTTVETTLDYQPHGCQAAASGTSDPPGRLQ